MATINYRLKKGYIAQFDIAFKGVKAFSNDTMTDELAAEYLNRYPARAIYFDRIPSPTKVSAPAGIKVIKPKDTEPEENILDKTIGDIMGKPEDEEITAIRAKLDDLNVKYHPRTGIVKLRKLLEDTLNFIE